uniref:Secretoglobin family 3A member 1 n=1 Tax=Neovison vison TaxID=452646 RepID=A0A8C7AYD0_NEOVI
MKLTAAFLVLCVALLSQPAASFFGNSMAKPVASALSAAEAGTEAVAGAGAKVQPFLGSFNPLKFMLTMLGIPVEHLVEGSRKCVAELGPEAVEAMGAMKTLLVTWDTLGVPCESSPSQPPIEWKHPFPKRLTRRLGPV